VDKKNADDDVPNKGNLCSKFGVFYLCNRSRFRRRTSFLRFALYL